MHLLDNDVLLILQAQLVEEFVVKQRTQLKGRQEYLGVYEHGYHDYLPISLLLQFVAVLEKV